MRVPFIVLILLSTVNLTAQIPHSPNVTGAQGMRQGKRVDFREAQIKLRANFPDPFFWGAFVFAGSK